MKSEPELYKCVITPNVRTIKMRSSKWKVMPGAHVIEDHTKKPIIVTVIRPGTQAIESFTIDKRGRKRVVETHLPGGIVVKGRLPGQKRPRRR